VHAIAVENSTNVLLEDSEVYDYHRDAVSIWQSRYVTVRRSYANGRGPVSQSRASFVLYGASDSLLENCIVEGNGQQFSIVGIGIPRTLRAWGGDATRSWAPSPTMRAV